MCINLYLFLLEDLWHRLSQVPQPHPEVLGDQLPLAHQHCPEGLWDQVVLLDSQDHQVALEDHLLLLVLGYLLVLGSLQDLAHHLHHPVLGNLEDLLLYDCNL